MFPESSGRCRADWLPAEHPSLADTAVASPSRAWVNDAIRKIQADANRTADTHLRRFPLPKSWGIDLYLKDESVHPTGSLKHRLARSLFLFGLVNGDITEGTSLVEASSGSTAVSEAYFAKLVGLPFVAVMPKSTSSAKLALIERFGGKCLLTENASQVAREASRLGDQPHWFYMDQFNKASIVTDWRGNNNIACSIFEQMSYERFPMPSWIVVGAGTGGTSATIGRYCRYQGVGTQLAVVDPEGSAYYDSWASGDCAVRTAGSRIEGIGRPTMETSFIPGVVDDMFRIPDPASVAAMRLLADRTGTKAGPSTGTNLAGALTLVDRMRRNGERGSIVTLICDSAERYYDTYYSQQWLDEQGWEVSGPYNELIGIVDAG